VTGGSSGIGRATVRAFAREGAHVYAAARRLDLLEELRGEPAAGQNEPAAGTIEAVELDVRDVPAVRQAIRDVVTADGRLDVLVNCAGIGRMKPALDLTEDDWRDLVATNLTSVLFASQEAARHMAGAGGGAIVSISSICAFMSESPDLAYCATKSGITMVTQCLAHELGHLGVRVNAVAPGLTATPMLDDDLELPDAYEHLMRKIPLRRAAAPEEQAAAILFLASDDASFITGETLVVDGGQTKGFWYYREDEPPVPPA
jgi:NAD(P)-dependent dehydrogenase (short-subunit alcohol dehydrogenase family)